MTKELRELPLFYGSQTVSWEEDGCTNQLHRLVLAINRGVDGYGKIKYEGIDEIINNIHIIWKRAQLPTRSTNKNSNDLYEFYWPLFKKAVAKYADVNFLFYKKSELDEAVTTGYLRLIVFKQKLSNLSNVPSSNLIMKRTKDDLERITDSHDTLQYAMLRSEQKKECTRHIIHKYVQTSSKVETSLANLIVGRLFIGNGFAGMTLMTTDPSVTKASKIAFTQIENYINKVEGSEPLYLKTLLISEQETGHWIKSDHRAEQEHPLLEISGNANANDFVPIKNSLERKIRVNTRHLFYANTVNIALKDTPPQLFNVVVEKLEKKDKHQKDWCKEATECDYRVKVAMTVDDTIINAYIYAETIDFSLGMGVGQNRSFEEAIQYELTRPNTKLEISPEMGELLMKKYSTYDQIKGYTPIIHGNDYDLSSKERQSLNSKKNRRVVVIGGAGGAATAYRIAVLGTDRHGIRLVDENGELLKDKEGLSQNQNVKIFARGKVRYPNLASQAIESFTHAKSKKQLFEDYLLLGIKITENDEIVLRFHKKEGALRIEREEALNFKRMMKSPGKHSRLVIPEVIEVDGKFYIVNPHIEICDQLIAGMGQDASKIQSLVLDEIEESELKIIKGYDGHFVALSTESEKVRFHGAMGGNISNGINKELSISLRNSFLPRNGNDQNIMPCVIGKMFSFFSVFSTNDVQYRRMSFNVNTCFLKRADSKNEKCEFQIFLEDAGLDENEAEKFIDFLLKKRQEDKTGAGVSFEDLEKYINTENNSDKLKIVSSCTLTAIKYTNLGKDIINNKLLIKC